MKLTDPNLSRRDFLKLAGLGLGTLALDPFNRVLPLADFPASDRLGRNCTGGKVDIKSQPDVASSTVKTIYEDTVLPWLREVNALNHDLNRINQRWVETPEGFVYSSYLQPVRNQPNTPFKSMPDGKPGFWAELTVPYVDFVLDNPPASSPGLRNLISYGLPTRLYYSQVMWIDQIRISEATGNPLYRVNENGGRPSGVTGGSYGDIYWTDGAAFRPLTADEITPISPDVDPNEKKVVVNVTDQYLSCFESEKEIYFCRVSTGAGGNAATPLGELTVWRKTLSIHMAAGTVDAGYDTPGVSWTTLFSRDGQAIHSTFWHNQFGERRSHGCVNCRPEDAKWIFRWTTPPVSLETSDVTWNDWRSGSTKVIVEERYF
jgi:lipoprotein-anchoring transpeptidase ErfK/SrfK